MAESDTILQLGIDAAREGNREEARNLFDLLTRQEPNNASAWLWLAGVANSPEERRAALERVVALDPTNEMAIKGLQAMGVSPHASAAPPPVAAPAPLDRNLSEEERYAAELDSAFDDYDTVEKEGPAFSNTPTPLTDPTTAADAGLPPVGGTSARERVENRRSTRRTFDDEFAAPPRRGPSRLLLGLLALLALVLLLIFVIPPLLNRDGGPSVAGDPTAGTPTGPTPTPELSAGGTGVPSGTGVLTDTGTPSGTGVLTDTGVPTDTLVPTTPPLVPTTPPAQGDLAAANPAPVPVGTPLSSNGWTYTFPAGCIGSCAVVLGNQIGGFTANGRYIHTLVYVANNTGTSQPVPPSFFVIKDAQGRVYRALPQVSSAYVIPGVNADLNQEAAVPANGLFTSVGLIFEVAPGATDLVLFTEGNTAQGWPVIGAVP